MKKISVILVIITLFNFIFCNFIYADVDLLDDDTEITYSKDAYDQLTEEGTADLDGTDVDISDSNTTSMAGSASGTIASIIAAPFMVVSTILSSITELGGITGGDGYTSLESSAYNSGYFTICSLVFGEYLMFDTKIYQTSADYNDGEEISSFAGIIDNIKENILAWFYILRYVAMAIILVLLIVYGISFLKDKNPAKKATEKKALASWATGLGFIFLFPYIIAFADYIIDSLMDILWTLRYNLEYTRRI